MKIQMQFMHMWEQWQRYLSPDNYLQPQWLFGIAVLAVLGLIVSVWMGVSFKRRLRLFAAARLYAPINASWALGFKYIRLFLALIGMMFLLIALARPMGYAQSQEADRQGSNFVIALDGSQSMLAEDVTPNRFHLAQQGIQSLLDNFGGDRAAAMLFAGTPTLVAPLTFDTVSLQLVMQQLDPQLSGKVGSSMSAAIERAAEYLSRKNYPSKAIIVFSDGEETEGDGVIAAQEAYQKHGVRVFTIGVGTSNGGSIPKWERNLNRELVKAGVLRSGEGDIVHSRMDEQTLQLMARVAGGRYLDLWEVKGDLRSFYEESLKPLAAPLDAVPLEDREELFQIPLCIGLALLLLEMVWPLSRKVKLRKTSAQDGSARDWQLRPRQPVTTPTSLGNAINKKSAQRAVGMALLLAAICVFFKVSITFATPVVFSPADATARQPNDRMTPAEKLLASGQYEQAFRLLQKKLLDNPNDALARYNYAVGAYASGRYSVAMETFAKLAAQPDPQVQARACLQWGNSLYRLGALMVKDNAEGGVVHWSRALDAYAKVTGQPMVHHNARFVRQLLMGKLNQVGSLKEQEGDEAGAVAPEYGVQGWQEALKFYEQALKVAVEEDEIKAAMRRRDGLVQKIYRAHFGVAEEKHRMAVAQQADSLELAIEQMNEAVAHYTAALQIKPNDPKATAGLNAAKKTFEPWQLAYAAEFVAQGQDVRFIDLDKAIDAWLKADPLYTRVLELNENSEPAQRAQAKLHGQLAEAFREYGDRLYVYSEERVREEKERQQLKEEALDAYQKAQEYKSVAAMEAKIMRLGRQVANRFVQRGQEELTNAQQIADAQPPEAMGWLERAVQSFSRALFFDKDNQQGIQGRDAAQALLTQLRTRDSLELQRKLAAQKKKPDPNAGKKAKQLLKVDTERLAKKEELKPEDKGIKEW